MFQLVAASVGLGLTTAIVTLTSQNQLSTSLANLGVNFTLGQIQTIHGILSGTASAHNMLNNLGPNLAVQITQLVYSAFVAGIQNGFRLDALLAFAGFLISLIYIHDKKSVKTSRRH
jgi:hypothetical protein